MSNTRTIPNPASSILRRAIVGGAGLSLPPTVDAPPGMAVVVLYVPIEELTGRSPLDLQADLGLPWLADDGAGIWFDELGA